MWLQKQLQHMLKQQFSIFIATDLRELFFLIPFLAYVKLNQIHFSDMK